MPHASSGIVRIGLIASIAWACDARVPDGKARRVILVTCDTLRADRLGAYGYPLPTSPNVDAFAREAVLFEEAYATTTWTVPSIGSILTGKLPEELGLERGNHFVLPPAAETIQELARGAGYATAAFVSNWVLRRPSSGLGDAGFGQGFETYDDRMPARVLNRASYERDAATTTDAALAWLDAHGRAEDRFFLWIHYMDPHGPYVPAPEDLARLERPPTDEPLVPLGETLLGRGQIPSYQNLDGERRPEIYRARYDAEIAGFDRGFGRFVEGLKARDLWSDSLVILTADHGESLGEHGYWFCHGENVHREQARVPLIVRFPDGHDRVAGNAGPAGTRVRELVGHLDVWPTVLEALGLPERPNRGVSWFRRSLPADRVNVQSLAAKRASPAWTCVSDGAFRLIQEGGTDPRLHDVRQDPAENEDLARGEPARAAELRRRGERWLEEARSTPLPPLLDEEDPRRADAMRALGYTEGDER